MTIAAEERVKELEQRVETLESELETMEARAVEAEVALAAQEDEDDDMARRLEAVSQHVWQNDRPGAAYCRACGRTYPIHRHDCPFGEVQ